jgi:hypothetical protein
VQEGYKDEQEIHSPSRVFQRFGELEAEGREAGWEKKGAMVAPTPKLAFSSGGGGGGGHVEAAVNVSISLPNVKDTKSFLTELAKPSALADVTKVFEDLVKTMGGPTQTTAQGIL